jgi:hypothetical protein
MNWMAHKVSQSVPDSEDRYTEQSIFGIQLLAISARHLVVTVSVSMGYARYKRRAGTNYWPASAMTGLSKYGIRNRALLS